MRADRVGHGSKLHHEVGRGRGRIRAKLQAAQVEDVIAVGPPREKWESRSKVIKG
jgi:hypothetical protein